MKLTRSHVLLIDILIVGVFVYRHITFGEQL
jgi:hypothetical protein